MRVCVAVCFVISCCGVLSAQESDPVSLKEWAVPFEQIRATVGETRPRKAAPRTPDLI